MKIITTQDKNILDITYWPTDICNFNCDYCFPGSTSGINRYPKDLDATLLMFKKLFKKYKDKTLFKITVAGGGEPTLWPELGEFSKRIKELANVELKIVSNGSRTLRWWEEYGKYFDSAALSCHHKEVNVEHFINVADLLYENNLDVTAQVLMDPQHWNDCVILLQELYNSKYEWFIQIKEVIGHGQYTKEQKDFLKTEFRRLVPSEKLIQNLENYNLIKSVQIDGDDIILSKNNSYIVNDTNTFKGWTCNFPNERIAIDSSGTIKGSCGLMFDMDTLEPVKCTKELCDCPPDTHITKWKT